MNKEYLVYNNGNEFMSLPANSENEKGFKDFIEEEKRKGNKTFKVTIWNPKERTKVACDYDINSKKFKNISNGFTASQPTVIKKGHTNKIKNGKNEPRISLQNKYTKNEVSVNVLMKCSNRIDLFASIVFDVKERYNLSQIYEVYHKIFGKRFTVSKGDEKFYYVRVAKNEKASRLFLQKCYENIPEIMLWYEEYKDMYNC